MSAIPSLLTDPSCCQTPGLGSSANCLSRVCLLALKHPPTHNRDPTTKLSLVLQLPAALSRSVPTSYGLLQGTMGISTASQGNPQMQAPLGSHRVPTHLRILEPSPAPGPHSLTELGREKAASYSSRGLGTGRRLACALPSVPPSSASHSRAHTLKASGTPSSPRPGVHLLCSHCPALGCPA